MVQVIIIVISLQVNSKVDGKAPIHWAIQTNNIDALKCLLEHHADVNILVSVDACVKLINVISSPLTIVNRMNFSKLLFITA